MNNVEPVLTHRAKTVVDAARLHGAKERRQRGLTLLEGPSLIADAIDAGVVVHEVFAVEGANVTLVDSPALQRLAGTKTPRGPIAVVEIPTEWLDRSRNLVVSVGVSDPGNVGTMVRTAAAFGWGFAYTQGSADPWSPKTIRAGASGQFQTSISKIGSLAEVKEWTTVAAVPREGGDFKAVVDRPVALLIGEEATGLEDWMIESADSILTISTPGVTESLNAAVAAAIAMYEFSKQPGDQQADV